MLAIFNHVRNEENVKYAAAQKASRDRKALKAKVKAAAEAAAEARAARRKHKK